MRIKEIINSDFGEAFKNISRAFHAHLPNTEWVNDNYDYILLYTIGAGEHKIFQTLPKDKVINFQACYLTAGLDHAEWQKMWQECFVTISYYDLQSYCSELVKVYQTPLGADPKVFNAQNRGNRPIKVFSTGHVAYSECLDKVFEACVQTNNKMYHTGENFKWSNNHYHYMNYMSIESLANLFNQTQYITGLRIYEGFEMACIEGAMCGATPIVFDLPSYSYYKDFARIINFKKDYIPQLVDIFNSPYEPLSDEQVQYVQNTFSWKKIIGDLYRAVF